MCIPISGLNSLKQLSFQRALRNNSLYRTINKSISLRNIICIVKALLVSFLVKNIRALSQDSYIVAHALTQWKDEQKHCYLLRKKRSAVT